jgi:hypothetical protein
MHQNQQPYGNIPIFILHMLLHSLPDAALTLHLYVDALMGRVVWLFAGKGWLAVVACSYCICISRQYSGEREELEWNNAPKARRCNITHCRQHTLQYPHLDRDGET